MAGTFDIFKIGIGPSSSHTVGPMVAANRFLKGLEPLNRITRIEARLFGSLAYTGKGHGSDKAVILGLAGEIPSEIDPETVGPLVAIVEANKKIALLGQHIISFDPEIDLVLDKKTPSPGHPNGMKFTAYDTDNNVIDAQVYFSVGGGAVMDAAEYQEFRATRVVTTEEVTLPYPFSSAMQLLNHAEQQHATIADIMLANEQARAKNPENNLDKIWTAMKLCIDRGLVAEGQLPGNLKVQRRAKNLFDAAGNHTPKNSSFPHQFMERVSAYAIAVNEENASGGRVVTSPTNGAAGVIPAVIRYYTDHCAGADQQGVRTFLLTAAAFGSIIKQNASLSGAEVGCQGEVGSASAMAAAGLCAALGGSNAQIENAAEIALEHHLGMTCDPVGGLVQIPCIERNAMGAVKAINAASLALAGDGTHIVSFDTVVETMRQTGLDMQSKYKETSQGGLAVTVVAC